MTFTIKDRSLGSTTPTVQVTITEIGDGQVGFDVVQLVDSVGNDAGDLRGSQASER